MTTLREALSTTHILYAVKGEEVVGWFYHPNREALADKAFEVKSLGYDVEVRKFRLADGEQETQPEVVICAAIRLPDGKVFRGNRHSDCIETAYKFVNWNGGVDPSEERWQPNMCDDQGFITSRNRYVGREEGFKLQQAAGLPSACLSGYRLSEYLFSEDLY